MHVGVTTAVLEGAPLCVRAVDSRMLFFVLPPDHPLQSPYILAAPVPAPRRTESGSETQQQQQRGRSGAGSVMRCLPLWGLRVDGLLQAFQTYPGSALGLGASSSGASAGGGAAGKRLFPRNTNSSTTKSTSKTAPQSEGGASSLLRPLVSSSANPEKEREGPGLNNEIDFRDFSRALAM